LVRQQLEICIFSNLATEFKTGDVCVVGSSSYADREQLLSHAECEPLIEEYCRLLEFPANSDDFVKHLQDKAQVASVVDEICAVDKQFTINRDGEPVLKRIPLAQTNEVEELELKSVL